MLNSQKIQHDIYQMQKSVAAAIQNINHVFVFVLMTQVMTQR